ncbi:leucine-rich repeat serine/threonine-protein kinase 2 isoform X2 [Aplysia californica]|uniref:non-specific serine/threonine protein kinase n=1 Tax=Aplysia californica TaxID=6500 RepID=A0ABM1W0B7_APLCA|nr:leucine-rich repeat serine/threonine-protein kinase 2 isoform X2 [Aplysia californica]
MNGVEVEGDSGRWSPHSGTMVKMFSDAREVDDVLRTLQHSAESDELKVALKRLVELFDGVPRYLEDNHAYLSVLSTMTHMVSDLEIQQLGLEILYNFMVKSPTMEDKMKRSDVFRHIIKLLSDHTKHHKLQDRAVCVLVRLLSSDYVKEKISLEKQWPRLLDAVMMTIVSFPTESDTVFNSLMVITHVLRAASELLELLAKKYLQVMLSLFQLHVDNAEILNKLCHVLWITAHSAAARPVLGLPVCNLITSQMPVWKANRSVVDSSFHLVEVLCLHGKVSELLVERGFIMGSLLPEMMSRTDEADLQLCGLKIFLLTAEYLFLNAAFAERASQWLKLIYLAMSRHMGRPDVQAWGCRALARLLECKPEVYMWIGESSELKQDPVHTLCLGAILMYEKKVDVFVPACKAIYYLTADNDGLCRNLMEKNSHIAIIEGLRYHVKDKRAVTAACRAIRGLGIFQHDHKCEIAQYDGDILHLLVDISKNFVRDAEVQSEIVSTVACLADVDMVRHQCYVLNVHSRVLEAMENFPGDEILQEAAIEALAVLGGAANGSEILHSNGAIDKIIKCLKRFTYNENIQKKGLMAIQILAEWSLVQSTGMCQELAQIIRSTMRNYPDSLLIQKEAIVSMQILAERGVEGERRDQYSNMAEVLVEMDCHELLFQILEKFDDDQGLHNLASECLYVLGIEQDLKSRMLLTACSRGFIAGAECLLEVGADVNIAQGSDSDTPLYLAVNNNDENMVRFLLRYEVRDVQTSLRLSLERNYHSITGLLLSYIGQDRETGTVVWSNVGLGDLRPEWVMPTLYGTEQTIHAHSSASKHFVAKIKDSELRRNRRIHQFVSDTNLEQIRNKCFRYRRPSSDIQNVVFDAIHEIRAQTQTSGKPRRPSTIPRFNDRKWTRRRIMGKDLVFTDVRDLPTSPLPSPEDLSPLDGLPASDGLDETPVFEHSEDDLEDWRMTTLTGANIPFSPCDPRRPTDPTKANELVPSGVRQLPGKWLRKYNPHENRSPRPSYSRSSSAGEGGEEVAETPAAVLHVSPEEDSWSPGVLTSDQVSSDTEVSGASRLSSAADDTDLDLSVDDIKQRKVEYHIRRLDISTNFIASLDLLTSMGGDLMNSFAWLEFLDLSGNNLEILPDDFYKSLSGVQTFCLGNNKFKQFPLSVIFCTKLVRLDLSGNLMENVDLEELARPLSVSELILSKNKLSQFPTAMNAALPHLSLLDLSCNDLSTLPNTPTNLSEMRSLDLSHNRIQLIPDEFLQGCHKLELLLAANNGLEVLPNEYVATALTRLSTVKLGHNDITEKEPFFVPKFILELLNVRTVDLSNNGLMGCPPPVLWKSQMLRELMLSKNNIFKLNLEGARAWSKLEKLHVSHNKLSELPKEIGMLSSLQSLDLSHNPALTTLPDELGLCSRLWEMPLDGLSLNLDGGLTRGRVKDLTMYLHNRLKKAQRYFRMKLMVVGYGGRGKTSLLQALKRRIKNNHLEKPAVTVGVIVDDWKYERQRFGRTVTYTLNTWDFAGQEDFYSTHQCFLSNRTLYLVVYDISMGTEEIDKLKPWLSNIHARAPGCPVIVVGTHYDLLPVEGRETVVADFELKLKELMHKPGFPVISCFAIVDLTKESPELDQLRKKVKDTVDDFKIKGQPVMGQKVPASYVRLGELLSEESKNVEKSFPVIRHGQLVRLVRTENLDLDEDEELKQAINFLHESGVLLHYNETTLQMRDFYFINPGWLCRMMAQVVTVPQINPFIDRNGVMKRVSAYMLFTGRETSGDSNFVFPSSLIPQYLHLLEKFEIALPRNEEELLVPCRLPFRRPNIELPVQNRSELVFRYYSMPYTPIGFWSRLLTRLIVFSESKFVENMLYLTEEPVIQYWREGIFVSWNSVAFILVDGLKSSSDEIHLTVPNTTHGYRLLGYLVDHMDSLVDEWFPGLTAIDPLLGKELLEKFVPCTDCPGPQSYVFRFEDLLKQSEHHSDILCPEHNGRVELAKLAPDVMLADIEPNFHLDLDQFEFKESPENLCGDGGFGSVYKAKYRGKVVAAKVFNAIGDIHPHKMLRQEATILRRLKHPSVISLVAVAVRPVRLVVMEFAPCKSLGGVLRSSTHLSRTLQLKICQQVAEGLDYLHSLKIIYRDMKPDNVLVFSLAPDSLINAKIADYGISQFTTLFGLTAQEGTPAYRAPEVIRGETYSFQADIFSLGVVMYVVLTGGLHPFDELEFKSEIDKAFAENLTVPPVTQRGCPPWPDMQDLISQCLCQVPDYRPKAGELFERLSCAELYSLREILPVSVGTTVECMTTQNLGNKNVRLWVASGDNEYMQLSWLNLLDYREDSLLADRNRQSVDYSGMGTMFRDGRVLCILPVSPEHILLGTQAGKIWVFNTSRNELMHSTRQLQDSVLSLFIVQSRGDDPLVLTGLANGKMALYPLSEILQGPDMDPIEMKLGESYEPVRCIMRSSVDRKLIASCGTKVIVMETKIGVAVETMFNTLKNSTPASAPITSMACGRLLYLAHRNSTEIQAWDTTRGRLKNTLNVSISFDLSRKDGRITSMVLHDTKTLWLGTGGGQIVLVDINNWTPIICTHRHTASVRCLLAVKLRGLVKYGPNPSTSVILSGGLGFKTRSENDVDKDNQYGCIGVWDADFPQTIKQFSDWSKKRKELIQTTSMRRSMMK